ncbi:MAG: protease modulator HflC [Bacillota bacterium]
MSNPEIIDIKPGKGTVGRGLRIVLTLGAILALAISQCLFIVHEGEVKVVRQMGAVVRIEDSAGLNFKLPFIQNIQTLPKYKMLYDSFPTEILTADKKPLIVDNYTLWRIKDARAFIRTVQNLPNAEKRIDATVYSVVRNKFSNVNYDEIVSGKRGDLNAEVTKIVADSLDRDNYGIEIIDVRIKRTDLPVQNQQSVFNRMKSEREKMAQQYLSEGDELARTIRADTDRKVKEIMAEAYATAKTIEGQGEQEAARIYNEAYSKDPQFYEMYRTLESYKTTLNGKPVIMLPINSPYTRLLLGR